MVRQKAKRNNLQITISKEPDVIERNLKQIDRDILDMEERITEMQTELDLWKKRKSEAIKLGIE